MTIKDNPSSASGTGKTSDSGAWEHLALAQLRAWDPTWADTWERMALNPWKQEVLPRKSVELIGLGVNAACTNLNPEGIRRHIRAALAADASRDETPMVLKMASLLGLHSCSLGAPILLEEAKAAGVGAVEHPRAATPLCDGMRAAGQWNEAWTPFYNLDPAWTEEVIAAGLPAYAGSVLSKEAPIFLRALKGSRPRASVQRECPLINSATSAPRQNYCAPSSCHRNNLEREHS